MAETAVVPSISPALETSHVISSTDGFHDATTVRYSAAAPTGVVYVHLVQGTHGAVPPDGPYAPPAKLLHDPVPIRHQNGIDDVITLQDGVQRAKFFGGLIVLISTSEFSKTTPGAPYATFDVGSLAVFTASTGASSGGGGSGSGPLQAPLPDTAALDLAGTHAAATTVASTVETPGSTAANTVEALGAQDFTGKARAVASDTGGHLEVQLYDVGYGSTVGGFHEPPLTVSDQALEQAAASAGAGGTASVQLVVQGGHGTPVTVQSAPDDITGPVSLASLNATTGTIAINWAQGTATFEVAGTWVGTIAFWGTLDASSPQWTPLLCRDTSGASAPASQVTGNGIWQANIAGLRSISVTMPAWTSGSASVSVHVSATPAPVADPALAKLASAVTTGAPAAAAMQVEVVDGPVGVLDTATVALSTTMATTGSPVPGQGLLMEGTKAGGGGIAHPIMLDGFGDPIVVGAGSAGSPSGGVVTVQGAPGGQALPTTEATLDSTVVTSGSAVPLKGVLLEGSAGGTARPIALDASGDEVVVPVFAPSVASLPDVTPTSSATAFGSLAKGPQGILVTCDPKSTGHCRISGSDVATNQGQPFGPGSSYTFQVANANELSHILVDGTPVLCVTAV